MYLVAIKVKIGLDDKGYAKYPDFNNISSVIRHDLDWSSYIDTYGSGWHYDKQSGHRENSIDSPFGQQWGILMIPKDFASAALALFPEEVSEMIETEVETFYNTKAHLHEPDEKIDADILAQIKTKQDIGVPLTSNQIKAIDPDDPTPGIVKNKNKLWADYKTLIDVEIVAIK